MAVVACSFSYLHLNEGLTLYQNQPILRIEKKNTPKTRAQEPVSVAQIFPKGVDILTQ